MGDKLGKVEAAGGVGLGGTQDNMERLKTDVQVEIKGLRDRMAKVEGSSGFGVGGTGGGGGTCAMDSERRIWWNGSTKRVI